jgi:hypothetical protein
MAVKVAMVGVVGMVVCVVVGVVVVAAMATIEVEATVKSVQVVIQVADAFFVPMVRSLLPVHLERCSFQRTHLQILWHFKH